mgnify:CR=1 FL=1
MLGMSVAGNAVGILLGCAFNDVKTAVDVTPLLILPMMIVGGLFINSDSLPG